MQRRFSIAVQDRSAQARSGFAWLELLLGLAAIALLFQLFPAILAKLLGVVDLRNWSQLTFFLVNIGVVLALIGVRFGPDWVEDWQERRQQVAKDYIKAEKAKKLKEQREAVERMETSRSRRMY